MAIRFLLDECSRDKKLWNAIQHHNRSNPTEQIVAIRVGDEGAPVDGTQDPEIVRWAATNQWIIFSRDANTLRNEHDNFVAGGNHTAGLLLLRPGFPIPEIIECLLLVTYENPHDWVNRTDFIPF